MSDLTTLDAVKKAAERAASRVHALADDLGRRGVKDAARACRYAAAAFEAFSQELEAAMRNPRDKTDG